MFQSIALLFLSALPLVCIAAPLEILPPGHRPQSPSVHALVGGTVVTAPGKLIEDGTVILRDGRIEKVGQGLEVPKDARVWEMKGTFIYAGFIDPYLTIKPRTPNSWAVSDNDFHDHGATSHDIKFFGVPGQEKDPGNPGAGYGLPDVTPEKRVAETFTNDPKSFSALHELGYTSGNVIPEKGIIRGTSAFVLLQDENPTKTILKADVAQLVVVDQAAARDEKYPNSLMGQIAAIRQAFFDAQYHASGGQGNRHYNPAMEALVPAAEKKMPVFMEPGSALMVDRFGRIARELKVDIVMVSSGQEWRRPDLIGEVGAPFIVGLNLPEVPKLPEEDDWMAVSLDQLRTWDWAPENATVLRQQGRDVALTTYGLADRKNFRKNLRFVIDRGLSEEDAIAALTTIPAKLCGLSDKLGTIEEGKIANLTVVEGNYFVATNKVREVWVNGLVYRVQPGAKSDAVAQRPEEAREATQAKAEAEEKKQDESKQERKRELLSDRNARSPQEGKGALLTPNVIHIKNATIWTAGADGKLDKADLIAEGGKVKAIGNALDTPAGAHVIDGEGKHVTPGLIDCHSHSMILGGVNEMTLPSTAMVRIGDVINSETRRITEELAGGLTVANMLHGSANPIGGQNCVIKLRNGASPEAMKLEGAPEGIKFALGENVKQGNRPGNSLRFPQTRMGVPTFMENRFTAATRYLADWQTFRDTGGSPEKMPRRDLELEAIGEILNGKRLIHCHSYRGDEILAFLRVMERFKVKVATLQHVLEGYKVADEIAKHGAGASCFTDWWGYKFEVIDAIPFAGALMHERGVVVSFNSDSGDLSRRMYIEAAKAVKYGGLSEEEALKFVTINPARQLGIENRVGSLEPGKDADFAVWSTSPLDTATVCLETWIDGKQYFDRTKVAEQSAALIKEREELLEKAKKVAGLTKPSPTVSDKEKVAFFQAPLELLYENRDRHCDSH